MSLDAEALQAFPKVSLHDHLDGGLRPQTIIELAADIGHRLPADNSDDLGRWFAESANQDLWCAIWKRSIRPLR